MNNNGTPSNAKKKALILSILIFFSLFFSLFLFFWRTPISSAAAIDDLREKIDDRNNKIAEIEKEIAAYQKQIDATGKEAKSLQGAIQTLNLERKRILSEIDVTQNKIESVTYNLEEITVDIKNKEAKIDNNTKALKKSIRDIDQMDSISFIEKMLIYESISEVLAHVDSIEQFQSSVNDKLEELEILKMELLQKKEENEKKRGELINLKEEYTDKKQLTEQQKKDKDKLLADTKNKEANYKKILEEKKRLKEEFEQELFEFESKLRLEIDPQSIPPAGKGILKWPLDSILVTQHFGQTDFSRANSSVYNGKGHNGVDFRAARGTRIKAALSGTVSGIGNTDVQSGCYSYGKWVLIDHANGLSTLYAHLDLIKVKAGESVVTGDIIGYSGNTGYSTGPHLHFGVYATKGVKIVRFGDVRPKTNCSNVQLPVADLRAYLNPLLYL